MSNPTSGLFTLSIPAGTLVYGERDGLVKLAGDVIAFGASRNDDGSFTYGVFRNRYHVAAGCCSFKEEPDHTEMSYPGGLVTFA